MSDKLYIDSNEPSSVHVNTKLTVKDRQDNVEIQAKGLKTGDFVYKDVVIERKEASDLASSIKDGRLKEQTLRMSEDFQHQYIIVEDNPYNLEYSNLHDNAFIGTMVSRGYAGIPIIYTPDVQGTAYAINKIIEKHKDQGGEERTLKLERTSVETEDVQVAMLACVKGVSREKAERIKEHVFPNGFTPAFADLVQVKDKLKQVEGVGEITSQRIIDAFTEA